ncbi:5-formyltetrahydrofolate cyclo-ligase [Catenisphaera adipataccumulans]|uniref:5-formyltetrahydrofolate cyclo-ligase n=1 Tax=Catenisphaera adipataccumulans TaxID=700500 RepID=A0A7W8CVN0_9FIRM|nr:5-formyltetrahydrofolate cyclo-ligase [Catenisphaera adipataccumulans]MBB5182457.1 5-formyltetrahydrofolate cyclo-ligase [Catenisphaera adipataccumulans]
MIEKRTLRRQLPILNETYCLEADRRMTAQILASDWFQEARSIFVYVNMDLEPSTRTIIETAWQNKKVFVPKCISKNEMIAVQIRSWNDLQEGTMHILEPIHDEPSDVDFDLGLIPCVAAGTHGQRLGHGAGYYDRFLQGKHMKKLCLCYEKRICDEIEMDAHDVYMDAVVTEKNWYYFQ